jgi:Mg2+ and Co2+ transporter CorA
MHPTENTLEILAKIFDIHPLTIKDALVMRDGSHQKHEIFEHYHAISMSEAFYEPGSNNLQSVDIFLIVMSDVIISLRHDLSGSVEDVKNQLKHGTLVVREPWRFIFFLAKSFFDSRVLFLAFDIQTRTSVIESSWIMYSILNSICEMFVDLVRQILLEMRTLNELVLVLTAGEQSDFLRRIGLARDRVSFLRSQMIAKRDILRSLCLSGDSSSHLKYASSIVPAADIRLRQDTKLFLRDVLHSVMKMMDQVEEARETLANVNNTYLARVSIEVSEASNRMNQVMKKFNAMATIVLPLTLVTGLWGMNVPVPGQIAEEKPDLSWFFSIVGGLVLACLLSLFIFRRFNWM